MSKFLYSTEETWWRHSYNKSQDFPLKKKKKKDVCEKLMPLKRPFFYLWPWYLTLTLADDLNLGTNICVSMRCAIMPNMSLVTKLVLEWEGNIKFLG